MTGTDTGVGKSWVTAAIALCLKQSGLKVGVIKPVATGVTNPLDPANDASIMLAASGWPVNQAFVQMANPISYEAAAAPTVAARAQGHRLEWPHLVYSVESSAQAWLEHGADCLLIEGVGGLHCPLAEGGKTVLDLISLLDYPSIVVARRGLGTLSHTIGVVKALQARPNRILGVILNQVPADNPAGLPESTAALELTSHIAPAAVLMDGKLADGPADIAARMGILRWETRLAQPRW